MRTVLSSFILLGMSLLVAACAPPDRDAFANFGYGRTGYERRLERGSGQWTPSSITLRCDGPHCRPQVGMLVRVESQDSSGWTIGRCTATLVGADLIVSAAHCVDRNLGRPTYFFTAQGHRSRVTNVEFWRYTPDASNKDDIPPDAVVLRLEAALDLTPLPIARGDRPAYGSLKALVVNSNSNVEFRIDELNCPIRRTPEFPFEILENPEMILSVGCGVIPGNSGGPLFAPGRDEVEAVITANVPTDSRGLGWFTNLRCQPVLGRAPAQCVALTKDNRKERYKEQLQRASGAIASLSEVERSQWATEDELFQYGLEGLIENMPALEVMSQPTCVREGVGVLSEIRIIDQLVKFDNGSGVFEAKLVKTRTLIGRVIHNYEGRVYKIEVDWPAPWAPLQEPRSHPRQRLGKAFTLELPRCAR